MKPLLLGFSIRGAFLVKNNENHIAPTIKGNTKIAASACPISLDNLGISAPPTKIPILANILIIAEVVCLKLIATDLDIELIEEIDEKIEKGGSLTAPAHLVYDIIRKLPDASEITLSKDDNQDHLTIRSGKSNFKLLRNSEG